MTGRGGGRARKRRKGWGSSEKRGWKWTEYIVN